MSRSQYDSYLQVFLDDLQQRGCQMTNQRQSIAGLVFAIESPFSAYDLITMSRLLPDDHRVSSATIYRTLGELVDAGMITSEGDGEQTRYTRL